MKKPLVMAIVFLFFLGFAAAYKTQTASAQQGEEKYPTKPIRVIFPVEPGSGGDVLCRPLIEKMSKILGKPMIVINKPGASGSIGLKEVHDAKPDGYTISASAPFIVTNKMQGLLPYDHREFDIIGIFQTDPGIVSSTSKKPWNTVKEVVAYAKANPGEVSIATSSKGAIWWLAAMAFQDASGVKFNVMPQAGAGGLATTQVAGGHADLGLLGIPEAKAQIEGGNIRLLAVMSKERLAGKFNYAPTLREEGILAEVSTFRAIVAPKGLPQPVFDKIFAATEKAANDPEYRNFLASQNSIPLWLPKEQAVKFYEEQARIYRPIIEKAGMYKGGN
jgi:tripartite-type tricarboxylate transporter receptor subunit TctC